MIEWKRIEELVWDGRPVLIWHWGPQTVEVYRVEKLRADFSDAHMNRQMRGRGTTHFAEVTPPEFV